MITSLLGRKCQIKVRKEGPQSITAIIVAVLDGGLGNKHIYEPAVNLQLEHQTRLLVELLDFDKGAIYEIPSEFAKLESENGKE